MWFLFALTTFFFWGIADLFYKKGNAPDEKYSHLKTSVTVGLVMGVTALFTLVIKGINYNPINLLVYLPVSAMYILSMTVGYFGLRYLELSVSSPIQNASGAVSCILLIIFLHKRPDTLSAVATVLISVGVILLGIAEKRNEDKAVLPEDKKYRMGLKAFLMPVLYCIIDSLGTFFDGKYLDDFSTTPLRDVTPDNYEDIANISYQLTFFIIAVLLLIYIRFIKKEKLIIHNQGNRVFAAVFETAGQFAYVYALSGNAVAAVPIIGSYCIASAVLARLFLKERLSASQYFAVFLVISGIIILGIVEGLAG